MNPNEAIELAKRVAEDRKELIILTPHPDAKGIDHDFESPTFNPTIWEHMNGYSKCEGQYELKNSD